ncbi:MAG: FadR/GntR family transcriptional regulator [Candidatus Binataceae bacterium]
MQARATLSKIRVLNGCDVLAEHLRKQILAGDVPEGTRLPPEREIVDQTGLSRGSVREALRILEVEGLVHTRPGRYGGSVIRLPSDEVIVRFLRLFIRGRRIRFRSLLETREAIEPMLAGLAAANRTEEDLEQLYKVTQDLEAAQTDVLRFHAENLKWHCAIGAASHNELLSAFLVSISHAVFEGTDFRNFASRAVARTVVQAHRRILDAIVAGDQAAARDHMERHIKAFGEKVEGIAPLDVSLV